MINIPSPNEEQTLQQNTITIPDPMDGVSFGSGDYKDLKAFQSALIDTALDPVNNPDLVGNIEKNKALIEQGYGPSLEENSILKVKADTQKQWESLLGQMTEEVPNSPEDQENLRNMLMTDAFVQQQLNQQYDQFAVSREAANQLTNLRAADPELDEYLVFGKENSTLVKEIEDSVKKRMMLDDAINQTDMENDNQGTFFWALDKMSELVASPLNTYAWLRSSNQLSDETNLNFIKKSEALMRMRRDLDRMPMEQFEQEFPKFIQKVKDTSAIFGADEGRILDTLKGIKSESTDSRFNMTNAWNAIDILPIVGGALKGAAIIDKSLAMAGAKSTIAQSAAQSAVTGSVSSLSSPGTVASTLTSAPFMKYNIPTGTSALTDKFLAQSEAVRNAVKDIPLGEMNSVEELQKAVDATTEAVEAQYKRYSVIETKTLDTDFTIGSGLPKVEMTIGKKDGGGWISKQAAINNAKKMGFNESNVFQDKTTGEWFTKTTRDVDYLNRIVEPLEQIDSFYRNYLGSFSDFFSSNAVKLDKFLMGTASVNRASTEAFSAALKPLVNNFSNLSRAEKFKVKELAVKSLDEEKWFNYKELKKLGYNDKEIVGYNTYRELNDISYFMANRAIYNDLRFKGYKDVTIKVGTKNKEFEIPTLAGVVIENTDSIRPDIKRIWNATEGKFVDGNTADLQKMVNSGQYKLVKFSDAVRTADDEPVQFVLARASEVRVDDLSQVQLAYLAGGRRNYAGKYFVKQADKGVYKDTGQSYVAGAFTHAVEQTPSNARTFVQNWNEALKDYVRIKDGKVKGQAAIELKKTIAEKTGLTFNQITKKLENKQMSLEPMEVVYDRDVPSFMRVENRGFSGPGADVDEGFRQYFSNFGIQGTLQARYKGFQNKRGGLLHDAEGNPAALLDPFEATDRAVTNSIRYGMWNNWRQRAVQQWVETAQKSKLYSSTDSLSHESANFDRLTAIKTSNPEELKRIRDMEAQRESIKRILNYKLPEQVWWESNVRKLAQSAFGEKFGLSGMDINHSDPFTAVRSVAFHAKLGLFNTTQFLLQAAHMPILASLNPIHFTEGLITNPVMAHIAATRRMDIVKEYGKMHKALGFKDAKDWEDFSEMFLNSGWHDIGGTTQYLDNMGMGSLGIGNAKINKFLEYGRKPFDLGEQISRRHAYYIAYKNVQEGNPKLVMNSPEGRRLVLQEANRLSFNMNSEFAGRLNKGFLSIPMQFKTYMFRYMEALAGRQFTAPEKARLVAGTFALYGANAIPGGKEALTYFEDKYGGQLSPEVMKFLRNGISDGMLYLGTNGEINTDFSRRVGFGASMTQEIRKIFDPNTASVFDFISGPVGSTIATPIGEAFWLTSVYANAEQGGFGHLLQKDLAPKLLTNISTWNTGMKAWYAWHYQQAMSNKTLAPIGPVNKYQSIFTMLGLPPAIEGDFSDAIYELKQNKEYIDKAADVVLRLRRDTALNPSIENFSDNATAIAQFLSAFPDNVKLQIISKANVKGDKQDGMVGIIEGMQKIRPNGPYSNLDYVNKQLMLDKLYSEDNR